MNILLVKPNLSLKKEAIAYKKEHFAHDEFVINGSELFDKNDNYEERLEAVTNNAVESTVNPNWVLTDTFFAMNDDKKIIGIISFRHSLNDFLKDFGHIGYSVRPTERKKGYATKMLELVLTIAKNSGLDMVQLSCESDNIPSIKTIAKNAGKYEREFEFEGEKAYIYIVQL